MRMSLPQEWYTHIHCVNVYKGQIQGRKHIYNLLETFNACKYIRTQFVHIPLGYSHFQKFTRYFKTQLWQHNRCPKLSSLHLMVLLDQEGPPFQGVPKLCATTKLMQNSSTQRCVKWNGGHLELIQWLPKIMHLHFLPYFVWHIQAQ